MKRVTFNVSFFVKRTRIGKDGEVPVFLKVTVCREKVELSINLKVYLDYWNSSTRKSMRKDRKSIEVNNRLDTVRFRIMEIYREMELNAENITARKIVDKYLGVVTNENFQVCCPRKLK